MGRKSKDKRIDASNFRDFDWNKTKLFYHIVKCGSFIKAAQVAGTDQPALTRQIQILERQVGCPLLIRKQGAGKVSLTRKGEELFSEIAPFFLRMKGFCGNHYIDIGEEQKRKIRVAATHALAAYVIGDLLLAYHKSNPHLIFEIIEEDHALDVILNDVDIVIRPYDPEAQGIQQELLFTLEKKLYASKEYLEKYGEPETVNALKNHRLITTHLTSPQDCPYGDIHWLAKLGMSEGKKHNPIFMSNSIECRVNAAKNGIGIIAGYEEMSIIRDARLKNILPNVKDKKLEEYFIYPNYLKEDQEIINIKNYLRDSLANLRVTPYLCAA